MATPLRKSLVEIMVADGSLDWRPACAGWIVLAVEVRL
jgi:hypothetical protein